jgi:hypothetical protein
MEATRGRLQDGGLRSGSARERPRFAEGSARCALPCCNSIACEDRGAALSTRSAAWMSRQIASHQAYLSTRGRWSIPCGDGLQGSQAGARANRRRPTERARRDRPRARASTRRRGAQRGRRAAPPARVARRAGRHGCRRACRRGQDARGRAIRSNRSIRTAGLRSIVMERRAKPAEVTSGLDDGNAEPELHLRALHRHAR